MITGEEKNVDLENWIYACFCHESILLGLACCGHHKKLGTKGAPFSSGCVGGDNLLCGSPGLLQLLLVAAVFKKFKMAYSLKNVIQCLKLNIQSYLVLLLVFFCLLSHLENKVTLPVLPCCCCVRVPRQ